MDDWLRTEVEVATGQLSAGDWARLVWGLFWRAGVLALLGAGVALGVESAAHVTPAPPLHPTALRLAAGAAGLGALLLYVRWLLSARFGSLRLALIRTSQRD